MKLEPLVTIALSQKCLCDTCSQFVDGECIVAVNEDVEYVCNGCLVDNNNGWAHYGECKGCAKYRPLN